MVFITDVSKYIIKCLLMYLLCSIFHYIASHVYITWCVPYGIKGFFMSTLLTLSPHCQALRWVIYNGGICINTIWFLLGGWILNQFQNATHFILNFVNKENSDEKTNAAEVVNPRITIRNNRIRTKTIST